MLAYRIKDGGQETEVAHTGDDEGLLGGVGGGGPMEPEADQQVGTEADHLPEDEHEEKIVGQHQSQHGGGEEGHEGIIAVVARIALHIALGVDLHHQADEGDHHHHDGRQGVHQNADMDIEIADQGPLDIVHHQFVFRGAHHGQQYPEGQCAGGADGADGHIAGYFGPFVEEWPQDKADQQERCERQ